MYELEAESNRWVRHSPVNTASHSRNGSRTGGAHTVVWVQRGSLLEVEAEIYWDPPIRQGWGPLEKVTLSTQIDVDCLVF